MKTLFRIRVVSAAAALALAVVVAYPAPLSPQDAPAGIEGTIVKFGTNEPLSKAAVELRGAQSFTTTTEGDGRFYFPGVPPGSYRLYARRDGHWPAEYGQRWVDGPGQAITLGAGQRAAGAQVVMTPGGVIAGRITNRYGEPLAGARVRAMKPWIQENQRMLRVVQEVVANDLGEYRLIWLLPGRYYVSATYVDWPAGAQLVIDPDATNTGPNASRSVSRPVTSKPLGNGLAEDEVYTPIYFPKTLDGEQAVAIDLKQGDEYRGADINLTPVRTYHVRGRITNPPEPAAGGPRGAGGAPPAAGARGGGANQVRLAPLTPNGSLYSTQPDAVTGVFDFPKVIPGGYVLYMFIDGMTIRAPVEVVNGSVDGAFLTITAGVDVPVNVTFEGEPPKNMPPIANLRPTLWRDPTLLTAPAMPATAGESLTLHNIAPGNYRVYVNPILSPLNGSNPVVTAQAWQNVYVKSMRLGDTDVLNGGLHLSEKPDASLDVVIAANPGALAGRVLNDRQAPEPGVVVTLFADNPQNRVFRTDMYRVTSTDTAGQFQVGGLPPGDYRVFAWEGIENGSWMDPALVRAHEDEGRTVHIDEGSKQSLDVPVILPRAF